jgi:hypothetical protein
MKLYTVVLIAFLSILSSSCNREYPSKDTDNISSTPTPSPIVYDVICFQAVGLGVDRTMCSPDETYKVPRETEVTVYLKKETSVQQGTNTRIFFNYKNKINNGQTQKITIPEMESLASQGANIYTMYYHIVPVMLSNSQQFVEVELFNNKLGGFQMFDQDKTQVVFTTGDTNLRVEKPPRKEGLMGDMQAVQNGGIYRKKMIPTEPATKK